MKRCLGLLLLFGCVSRGGYDPNAADLSQPGSDADLASVDLASADLAAAPADLATASDLAPPTPSDLDCYYNWKTRPGCPAPEITDSYLSQNCVGTTGVFVVGRHFQHGNQYESMNGWMPHGPYALTSKLNRNTWNWLTPRAVCITTSADAAYWTNFEMQLRNPDGQLSNKVTVANRLGGRPALPTSGSSDPFDPNACEDAAMTQAQAVARFPAGASMVVLGDVAIRRRARSCNTLTGCAAWGADAAEATANARLQTTAGTVHLSLDNKDCGTLASSGGTIPTNSCAATGAAGSYYVHVAPSCLLLWQTVRSSIAGDGSYTQTDYGAVLRF